MEALLINTALAVAGFYFLTRNLIHYRSPEKLEAYLQRSPKAKIWTAKFGAEKTKYLTKRYFLPAGMLISLAFIVLSIRNLYHIIPAHL